MDFNATIDLIIKDLNEACLIIDDLKNYPGVPELQVELAKSKCKSAGDVIALLKSLKQQPVEPKIVKITEPQVKVVTPAEVKAAEPVEMFHQPAPSEEKKPPVKSVKLKQDEPPEKAKQESAIMADKFTGKTASFNERLGTRKSEDDVTEIIKSKHINSLNAAIGINDRFLFIREIFDGNKDAYEQAISKLEKTENEADAKAVIISYTGINSENEAVKQLLDLVKRKLTPDE
ncbi:MAG: hypothetical protein A2X05_07035 [Bacteroidetes bacterium GWE2_41_25]|nr:MAG: hypothetical protein A2X03_02925 [Bacteroidetes bacterium GWA2_40_15]OFX91139.1 MAG: hypothetical protein A2X05_07035 [Bacteroidetes bacterium GWE2_41_25]OFX95330.1 MAG: hypothetical protein A2X06_00590 [Bacteroidetes bacterium GWC2_40_22]OFY57086.1 MAG: hypothetical protein A2X04_05195 [Bacteroidetes bacterium GWF2_41_9]HBH85105.1 hypothetical protein [Bacteroidales bacterium]